MKTRRFFPLFFLTLLLLTTALTPFAQAAEGGTKSVEDPNVLAKAALLVDQKTGAVLYAKGVHEELPPASLTKIMTALLVLESVDAGKLTMDTPVEAHESAWDDLSSDGSSANIKVGEIMPVEDLLYCMMVVSANEACNILAEAVAGSVDAFVEQMNQRARELGCESTHFVNTTGLHDGAHYTTAWDLYLITKAAMSHEAFMTICDAAQVTIPATNLAEERTLYTTNYLLSNWRAIGYRYSNAHGIKTGSTSDAGYCLVSSAAKGSLAFISVVLGAERVVDPATNRANVRSFSETTRLFDWGFENFSYKVILTPNDMLASVPVTLSKEASHVSLHCTDEVEVLMPNVLNAEDLTRNIRFYAKSVEAPVLQGDRLAEVELSYGDTVYATVPLVSVAGVEASRSLVVQKQIREFLSQTSVRIAIAAVVVLILVLVVWKITMGRRRYRYGKSVSRKRNYRGRRRRF